MIVGGELEAGLPTSDVEVLDVSGQGLECDGMSPFPYDVEEASSAVLDGVTYICGGYGTTEISLEYETYGGCYRYFDYGWEWVADLVEPRRRAAAVAMEGYIWVVGGRDKDQKILDTTEMIFPNGTVVPGATMLYPLEWHCLNRVTDSKVIMTGGYNTAFGSSRRTYIYDFVESSWTEEAGMIDSRYGHVCEVIQSNGRGLEIMVAQGGFTQGSTERLNLNSLQWTAGLDLPKAISFATSVAYNSTILIIGGEVSGEHNYTTIYQYDVMSESWTERPEQLSTRRFHATSSIVDASTVICN
jgi:N-acetylneuraminic acid mutarotase